MRHYLSNILCVVRFVDVICYSNGNKEGLNLSTFTRLGLICLLKFYWGLFENNTFSFSTLRIESALFPRDTGAKQIRWPANRSDNKQLNRI